MKYISSRKNSHFKPGKPITLRNYTVGEIEIQLCHRSGFRYLPTTNKSHNYVSMSIL